MKEKILLITKTILLLTLFSSNAFSQGRSTTQTKGAIPHGAWEVAQITIEKKNNGSLETNVYSTAAEVKEYLPCPQTWEIKDSETIVLQYPNNRKETINYTFEDDQLIIATVGAIFKYQYSTNGETLTLTTTLKYGWSQPNGFVDNIEEKRIITLNMKK